MTRALLLPLLAALALPARAQSGDPALAPTDAAFRADLETVTRVAATAALAHARTGAFPDTPFALLGRTWAGDTGLRATPLSALTLAHDGEAVTVRYIPLPSDPYVREDEAVSLRLTPGEGGVYRGAYEIRRLSDPDDGGRPLPYDLAGRYRVERASGTLCIDAARVERLVAEGGFVPDPEALSDEPLTVRVHPPGEPIPVYYEATSGAGR